MLLTLTIQVAPDDEHDRVAAHSPSSTFSPSPPPSFHSRTPSPSRQHNRSDPERQRLVSNADRELADTFDSPSDDESDNGSASHVLDDRQRVMSGRPSGQPMSPPSNNGDDGDAHGRPRPVERRVTQLPAFAPATTNKVYGANNAVHDGVFANLSAKPERGEEVDEKPPVRARSLHAWFHQIRVANCSSNSRHTNRQPQTQRLHTGRLPFLLREAPPLTTFSLMAFPSALSSPLSGTA